MRLSKTAIPQRSGNCCSKQIFGKQEFSGRIRAKISVRMIPAVSGRVPARRGRRCRALGTCTGPRPPPASQPAADPPHGSSNQRNGMRRRKSRCAQADTTAPTKGCARSSVRPALHQRAQSHYALHMGHSAARVTLKRGLTKTSPSASIRLPPPRAHDPLCYSRS